MEKTKIKNQIEIRIREDFYACLPTCARSNETSCGKEHQIVWMPPAAQMNHFAKTLFDDIFAMASRAPSPQSPFPPCVRFFFCTNRGGRWTEQSPPPGPESSRCWAIRFSARFSLNFHTHLIFADRWIWFPWEISKSSASLSFYKLHTSIIIKENIYGYMFFLLSLCLPLFTLVYFFFVYVLCLYCV